MSFTERYNKVNNIFDIDISDFQFIKLKDVLSQFGKNPIKVDGLYINNKSDYGPHPVAISKDYGLLIDFPSYMTDDVNEILKDAESISLIKKGLVGLRAQKYTSKKFNKTCYGVQWVDL